MHYISTRGESGPRTFEDILFEGFASDGGLFVPEHLPKVSLETLRTWRALDYAGLAFEVMHLFWPELPRDRLWRVVRDVYQPKLYPHGRDPLGPEEVTPVRKLRDDVGLLELANGPTLSFDDLSMAFLAEVFKAGCGRIEGERVLVGATTGDMGAACEYAFANVEGCRVVMLSPRRRMSPWQRAELYACTAPNVTNLAVDGTFDDCQDILHEMLRDAEFAKKHRLGAVNSLLWARIAAQIVYYFYGYLHGVETVGEEIVFVTPGGNFGNAYAGWCARAMGLPVLRLIVATNENDAFDRFMRTGVYAPRPSSETLSTSSPSTDISRAANLERFLFEVLGRKSSRVRELMAELDEKGKFELTQTEYAALRRSGVSSGTSDHPNRLEIIEQLWVEYQTLVDPHTADCIYSGTYLHPVGVPTLCLETVDAVKFPGIVRSATGQLPTEPEGFEGLLKAAERKIDVPADAAAVRALVEEMAGA